MDGSQARDLKWLTLHFVGGRNFHLFAMNLDLLGLNILRGLSTLYCTERTNLF